MSYSLNALYVVVGTSKQAVHAYRNRQASYCRAVAGLLLAVDALREEHGGCGLEKMYRSLQPDFLGRDRFISLLQELGYGLKRKIRPYRTTYSSIFRYKNLITGLLVDGINQVWQTDITYIEAGEQFYYAIFIIDIYSKRIIAHQLSDNMYAKANLTALKKAFKVRKARCFPNLIHHSDRGSQYGAKLYTDALLAAQISISMGKKAQENAYAERINGTIKNEYLGFKSLSSFNDVNRELNRAVKHYNNDRIHNHLPHNYSPIQFEEYLHSQNPTARPFIIIHAFDRPNFLEAKSRKKATLNLMEKNDRTSTCPLINNPIYFHQSGQH